MRRCQQALVGLALAFATAGAAGAAMTADALWTIWQREAGVTGLALSRAGMTRTDDAVTWHDVMLANGGDRHVLSIPSLLLRAEADGGLVLVVADPVKVKFTLFGAGFAARLSHRNLSILAEEADGADVRYTISVEGITITFHATSAIAPSDDAARNLGITTDPATLAGGIRTSNMRGTITHGGEDVHRTTLDLAANSLDYHFDAFVPATGMRASGTNETTNLRALLDLRLPHATVLTGLSDIARLRRALDAGLLVDLDISRDEGRDDDEDPAGPATGDGGHPATRHPADAESPPSSASRTAIRLDRESLRVENVANDLQLAFTATGIPDEARLEIAESWLELALPVAPSAGPGDFRLRAGIRDLALNDILWQLIDRPALLVHTPMTLAVDLSGQVEGDLAALIALMANARRGGAPTPDAPPAETAERQNDAPDVAPMMSDSLPSGADDAETDRGATPDPAREGAISPPRLRALAINDLLLSAGGARMSAEGSFHLERANGDGIGADMVPVGSARITMTNLRYLMNRLADLGYLAPDAVAEASAALQIFARPGDEPSTLTSAIRAEPDGHIFINDRPIH